MCFYSETQDVQIRVYGQVSEVNDLSMKQDIVKNYPALKPLVDKEGLDVIVPFMMKKWDFKIAKRH